MTKSSRVTLRKERPIAIDSSSKMLLDLLILTEEVPLGSQSALERGEKQLLEHLFVEIILLHQEHGGCVKPGCC